MHPPPHSLLRDAADASKSMRRIRIYSKIMIQDFKDKFYRRKTRPTDLNKQVEVIYDDNINLKNKVN